MKKKLIQMLDDPLIKKDCGCLVERTSKNDIMVAPCREHRKETVVVVFDEKKG